MKKEWARRGFPTSNIVSASIRWEPVIPKPSYNGTRSKSRYFILAKKSLQKFPVLQTVSATALAQETSPLKVLQTFSLWASSTTLIHLICMHTVQSALGFPLPGLLLRPVNMLIPKQRLMCQKGGRKEEGKSAESLVPTCSVNLTSQCISKVKSSNSSKPGGRYKESFQ